MKVIITKNYAEASKKAALIFLNQAAIKPNSVFGLATGSTPLGLYAELIKNYQEQGYDFSQVATFNLDEYLGLAPSHEQSYSYFMFKNLFNHINIKKNNVHIPDGKAKDVNKFCADYERAIKKTPIDIQLLGIGGNGHIAFNEPGSSPTSKTRVVDLTKETMADNARFFADVNEVPRQAITMGVGTILSAKKIVLVANGKNKAQAIFAMVEGPMTAAVPASLLQKHPDVTVVVDEDAASLLKKTTKMKKLKIITVLATNLSLKKGLSTKSAFEVNYFL